MAVKPKGTVKSEALVKHKSTAKLPLKTKRQSKIKPPSRVKPETAVKPKKSGHAEQSDFALFSEDILSNVGVGTYIVQEGKFVYVSTLYQKLSGYSEQELINRNSLDYIHPNDRNATRKNAIKALKRERPEPYEYRFIKKNREIIYVLEMVTSVTYKGKRAALGSFMDITERKQMEDSLRQSEEKYRNILENIEEGYFEVDLAGKFTFVNDNVCRVTGYTKGELIGMDNRQYTDKKDLKDVYQAYHKVYATGKPIQELCWQITTKNGSKRYIAGSISLKKDASGKPAGFSGISRDTTERKRIEDELRKSELAFRSIFEASPVGICTIVNQKFVQVNPALCIITGYLPEELIGQPIHMSYRDHEEYRQVRRLLYDQILREGRGFVEAHLKRKNGEDVEGLLCISPIDPRDFSAGFEAIVMDITERKQAEEALKTANKQMRDIIEFLPDATLITDKDNKIIAWNRAMEELTGVSYEEVIRQKHRPAAIPFYSELLELVEMDDLELAARYSRVRRIGAVVHAEAFIPSLYHNRGAHVFAAVSPLLDSAGNIVGYIESIRDITEQKQAEEKLHKEEQRFRVFTEQSSDIILLVNREGKIIYENPAVRRILGLNIEERIGLNVFDNVHPEDMDIVVNTFHLLFRDVNAPVQKNELRIRHKDETWRTFEVVANSLVDEKSVDAIIVNLRDITDRKKAEEDRKKLQAQLIHAQKMESVGRLAGGIAHDFNNMLGVILGRAEMAMTRIDSAQPLYNDLEEIRKAAERSANLTRQLLAFARKQTVALKVLDLNETVEGMLKMLRRLIGEDIELAWLPDGGLLPVRMDPGQIDQILANLCVNARDAIAGVGKITIETGAVVFDEARRARHMDFIPGDYVMIAVSDDGTGMDKETLDKLFEPFFTTKEVGQGTGLGLATVYGIVKQNGGFVNVYSEHGQGTTFRIYLPRHVGKAEQVQKEEKGTVPGSEIVLLVEDEPAILEMTTMMLERLGYRVLTANTPGEAIELAQNHPGEIHLLMTDVVMPEMNGRDLSKNILSLYPEIKRLFMSGYTANVIAHQGVLDEGVHFIQKPFSMSGLAAKLREVIDKEF